MNHSTNLRTVYLKRLRALRGMPTAVAGLAAQRNLSEKQEAWVTQHVEQVCQQILATRNEVFPDDPYEPEETMLDDDPEEQAWTEFESWIDTQFPQQRAR